MCVLGIDVFVSTATRFLPLKCAYILLELASYVAAMIIILQSIFDFMFSGNVCRKERKYYILRMLEHIGGSFVISLFVIRRQGVLHMWVFTVNCLLSNHEYWKYN